MQDHSREQDEKERRTREAELAREAQAKVRGLTRSTSSTANSWGRRGNCTAHAVAGQVV